MFKGMKLSTKLIAAFMIVAAIAATIGVTGIVNVQTLDEKIAELGEEEVPQLQAVFELTEGILTSIGVEQALVNPQLDAEHKEDLYTAAEHAFEGIDTAIALYEDSSHLPEEKQLIEEFMPIINEWKGDHVQILELAHERDALLEGGATLSDPDVKAIEHDLEVIVAETAGDLAVIDEHVDKIAEHTEEMAHETTSSALAAGQNAIAILISVVAIGVLIAFAFGFLLSRSISRSLERVIADLSQGAEATAAASGQVASASQMVADGSNEGASSLEETSAAIAQISSQTESNAESAVQASKLSQEAQTAANEGSHSMAELRSAMDEINASSQEVGKVLKTIEEIAFQTNLLALNAAVEAARAGEHGKGFAVVAEEVRNLAQRAASATQDTAALIETSIGRAQKGVESTSQSADALEKIVAHTTQVANLLGEIQGASTEQAAGLGQVSTAVQQLSTVITQSASSSEEAAAAAEELSAQSVQLTGTVGSLTGLVRGSSDNSHSGRSMSEVLSDSASTVFGPGGTGTYQRASLKGNGYGNGRAKSENKALTHALLSGNPSQDLPLDSFEEDALKDF